MRDLLTISYEQFDFYSFEHAKECSLRIGLSKREFRDKEIVVKKESRKFALEVQMLFNLNLPQNQINLLMDELVIRAINNDFRGTAVDLLFYLKEKRDETVNKMLKNRIDIVQVELSIQEQDPFFLLEFNEDFAEKTKNLDNLFDPLDALGVHQRWTNYEQISEFTRNQLLIAAYQANKSKKDIISHHKKLRSLFILSEPFTHLFNINKADKLLRITRAIIRYRYLKGSYSSQFIKPMHELKTLLKDDTKIEEIEKRRIKTAKEFIQSEKSMLNNQKGPYEQVTQLYPIHSMHAFFKITPNIFKVG